MLHVSTSQLQRMVAPVEINQRFLFGPRPQAYHFAEKHVMGGMILNAHHPAIERGKRSLQYGRSGNLNFPPRQFEPLVLRQANAAGKRVCQLLMRAGKRVDGKNPIVDEQPVFLVDLRQADEDRTPSRPPSGLDRAVPHRPRS